MQYSPFTFLFLSAFLIFTVNSVYIGKRDEGLGLIEIGPGVLLKIETEIEEHTIFSSIDMVITELSTQIETVIETNIVTASENNMIYKTLFDIVTEVTTIEPITNFVTVVEYDYEYATEVLTYTETVPATSQLNFLSSSTVHQ
ncbi:hypothetical protein EDC96DRAFT_544630 [Choanephora cucurbitarum]|nr:hypothetical protein EDC96DRAFT_544630 [Choanephora cucurbitarum]